MDKKTEEHINKTIHDAQNVDDDAECVREREEKLDSEFAYEALAITSSMGMLGMEEENANLVQLALAQQLLYKSTTENPRAENGYDADNETAD